MKTYISIAMCVFVLLGCVWVQCAKAGECSHEYDGLICPDVFMMSQPYSMEVVGQYQGNPVIEAYIKVEGYPFDEVCALVVVYGGVVRLKAYQYNIDDVNYLFVLQDGRYNQVRPEKVEVNIEPKEKETNKES